MNKLRASAIETLIGRLDKCFGLIRNRNADKLGQQALVYAAFLSDLQAGKIKSDSPEVDEMVGLVEQFCQLVEEEL